jgi:hypothetical protein
MNYLTNYYKNLCEQLEMQLALLEAKVKDSKKKSKGKKLDPVGKEDGDIDNDGDEDETDGYLANRRKAIGKAMKNKKKVVKEETSTGVEGDYEGEMSKGELQYTIQNAQEILDQLKDDDELEAWVQSKITKASDYISTVKDYMAGRNK